MEREIITCFEWQSRASDFLDGSLSKDWQTRADYHLKTCKSCEERLKHYREIVSALSQQDRKALPAQLKKSLKSPVNRFDSLAANLGHWQRLPWYLRTILQGFGIVLMVLVGISSAPKIRSLYDKLWASRSSTSVSSSDDGALLAETEADLVSTHLPPLKGVTGALSQETTGGEDDVAGEDDTENTGRMGRAPLWRFTLKTVSPDEIRPLVIQTLTRLKVPSNTPGLGGVQVPGGIEFNLVLSESIIANLQEALEKLAGRHQTGQSAHSTADGKPENFSWYRVTSKTNLPEGRAKVIIWLTQP